MGPTRLDGRSAPSADLHPKGNRSTEAPMNALARSLALFSGMSALACSLAVAQTATPAPSQSPRPGLTAQQSKQAVGLAKGAMQELRKKTEGANQPEADRREFIVNVEMLNTKEEESPPGAEPEKAKGTDK